MFFVTHWRTRRSYIDEDVFELKKMQEDVFELKKIPGPAGVPHAPLDQTFCEHDRFSGLTMTPNHE